jgi:hypothetical protein
LIANASSDPTVEAKGAKAVADVTGGDEVEFQTNGKLSLVQELLRIVSVDPAVAEMFDRSAVNVDWLLTMSFSK